MALVAHIYGLRSVLSIARVVIRSEFTVGGGILVGEVYTEIINSVTQTGCDAVCVLPVCVCCAGYGITYRVDVTRFNTILLIHR